MDRDSIIIVVQVYAFSWLTSLIITIVAALIANGLWNVPLHHVANTMLSITLTVMIGSLVVFAILAILAIIEGEISVALFLICYSVVFALLPYSSVVGYTLYGYVGGHPLNGSSFVFNWYLGCGHDVATYLMNTLNKWVGHSADMHQPNWVALLPPVAQVPAWISALSAAGSLLAALRGRKRAYA